MVIPKQKSGVFTVEMKSTPSLRAGLIKAGKWQQVLANLHTKASGSQPFIDYQDNFYLVNVTTGTPPQQFNIVPDTGSSNYWLIDANKCTNQACQGYPNSGYTKHRFDSTKSTTFKSLGTSFSLQYGSGSCVGTLAFAGLTYGSQTFGLASSIADVFGYQIMDGIMGLGWPALSDNKVVPPMQNLLSTLDKPLFTVWMDRITNPPSQGGNGGLITYGALDTINCDTTFNYVTLSSQTYWQFAVDSFSVGTYNVPKSQQVISDTGTSWLGGPPKLINYIVLATNAKYDALNQAYTVSCTASGLPDIVFIIGGITYNIPSTEYVLDMGLGNGDCVVTIFDMEFTGFGPQWILGDTFIRTYCNVYDIGNGQIGFSKAHHKSV
uniref:Peptidase A1 domain-containing protein n=1 Tax=Acrobeloides nanus TaxID=290746 RepID=A0A914C440_9BILA